jgi:hypothetical protein
MVCSCVSSQAAVHLLTLLLNFLNCLWHTRFEQRVLSFNQTHPPCKTLDHLLSSPLFILVCFPNGWPVRLSLIFTFLMEGCHDPILHELPNIWLAPCSPRLLPLALVCSPLVVF